MTHVDSGREYDHVVSILQGILKCDCLFSNFYGFPCRHIMSIATKRNINLDMLSIRGRLKKKYEVRILILTNFMHKEQFLPKTLEFHQEEEENEEEKIEKNKLIKGKKTDSCQTSSFKEVQSLSKFNKIYYGC